MLRIISTLICIFALFGCSTAIPDLYESNRDRINRAVASSEDLTKREVGLRRETYLRTVAELAAAERASQERRAAMDRAFKEEQSRASAAQEAKAKADEAVAVERRAEELKEQQRKQALVDKEVRMVMDGKIPRPISLLAAAKVHSANNPSVIAQPLLQGDGKNYVFEATAVHATSNGTRLLFDMDPLNSRILTGELLFGGMGAYAAANINTKFYGLLTPDVRSWMTSNGIGLNQKIYGVGRYIDNQNGLPILQILWVGLQKSPTR